MEELRQPDKEKGLIENCSNNVVLFAEYMLGIKLYAWQVYFLNNIQEAMKDPDSEREFIALTSRQVGKSTALAIFSNWCAVFNKYPGTHANNTITGIASASDVQAKKLLYEMKKLLRLGDAYIRDKYKDEDDKPLFGEEFFSSLLSEQDPNNTTTITFKPYNENEHGAFLLKGSKAGSVIKSHPATSVVLGETFSVVIIDEAGKSDRITDQFFYDYMYPTGNSTNALRIYTSTPWTPSGFFYRMVNPDDLYNDSSAITYLFTIEAIADENPMQYKTVQKTIKALNADGKIDEVQRAYYCRFVKGEQTYFEPNDVFEMFSSELSQAMTYSGPCDVGVDFGGQVTSRTVITVSTLNDKGEIHRLWHRVYEVGKDDNLVEDIENLVLPYFNVQRIIPDDCPQGDFMIRKMKDKGWDIQPMNFRQEKVKKYGAFRSALHRKEITSYKDDDLQAEMLALEYSTGRQQSVIQHAPGYSDDLIDSFIMSCFFYVVDEGGFKLFDVEDEDIKCAKCGSDNILREEIKGDLKYQCMVCGKEWYDEREDDDLYGEW